MTTPLRWLNKVLRAVSGNPRDGACFKLDKKHGGKKAMVHRRRFLKIYPLTFCDIWQNCFSYRILNNICSNGMINYSKLCASL